MHSTPRLIMAGGGGWFRFAVFTFPSPPTPRDHGILMAFPDHLNLYFHLYHHSRAMTQDISTSALCASADTTENTTLLFRYLRFWITQTATWSLQCPERGSKYNTSFFSLLPSEGFRGRWLVYHLLVKASYERIRGYSRRSMSF